jgi:hypothetical protein
MTRLSETQLTGGQNWTMAASGDCLTCQAQERANNKAPWSFLEGGRHLQGLARRAALACLLAIPAVIYGMELQKQTQDAFENYVRLTEVRIAGELHQLDKFLWVDTLPEPRQRMLYERLQHGQVVIERQETRDNGNPIQVPDGLAHHWVGIIFIPGATVPQTLALLQDYDNHYNIYKPEVTSSKLLHRSGDHFNIYLRLNKKKIITTVFNTEHEVTYYSVDDTHAFSRSYSTRIAEVENPGLSDEHEKPVGNDHGFLWRINAYWRFQEKDGGVYVQCEAVSLTRNVPTGTGWLIGPFIQDIPRESLSHTLASTRTALTSKTLVISITPMRSANIF